MPDYTNLLQMLRSETAYPKKRQTLSGMLTVFEGKNIRLDDPDRAAFTDFAFSELDVIRKLIPTLESYREKDEVFGYADALLGLIMLCNPSSDVLTGEQLEKVNVIRNAMAREQSVENAIDAVFTQGRSDKQAVADLLYMLSSIKDEARRGMLYKGLLHYKEQITSLPEESLELLADYTAAEINRYVDSALNDDIILNLEIACDVCGYFYNDAIAGALKRVFELRQNNISYYAMDTLLCAGQSIPRSTISLLANDIEYAFLTYTALAEHDLTGLFPEELANDEYLAKSDMVHWLLYPTELGEQPDEIEYLGAVEKKKVVYHIFRFKSESDNLDEDSQGEWLIGWSAADGNTFSEFDLYEDYEQKTLEKTLKNIKKKLL